MLCVGMYVDLDVHTHTLSMLSFIRFTESKGSQ